MRAPVHQVARGWPLLAGALLGLAVGGIWTLAQPDRYRAETGVLLRGAAVSRMLPAAKALAQSSLLQQNVAQTLHLAHPPRVAAEGNTGGVLTLAVEAGSPERARQIDAEVALVLTHLVAARFGSEPRIEATVLDPAHPAGQTSPTPGRNLLVGGLIGLAAGAVAALSLAWRRPRSAIRDSFGAASDALLQARIEAVSQRERDIARRAGELAGRERELDERERGLLDRERATEPAPAATPAPAAEPMPPEAVTTAVPSRWNLRDLERAVEAGRAPDREFELRSYLVYLKDFADADGTLPAQFDPLIGEIFGDIEGH